MGELYDKHGVPIREFDVIKMFHFIGARKKRYYMYKWVISKNGYLYGHHLGRHGDKDAFMLHQDLLDEVEVVQGYGPNGRDDFEDRVKRKPVRAEAGASSASP